MERLKPKFWAIITFVLALVYFLGPLVSVFIFSLKAKKGTFSFTAYGNVLRDPAFFNSFFFSFKTALAVILLGLLLIIPAVMYVRLRAPRLQGPMETLANLPFTVPVIVLAFGLIRLYGKPPVALISNPLLLVAGYITICLPYLYRTIDSGFAAMDLKTLTEASASLGAPGFRTLVEVVLPNLKTALVAAASIIFALVMGELTLAILLAWPAFGPWMAQIGRDLAYEPAALAVMSFGLTWLSIALFHAASRVLGDTSFKAPVA